MLFFIEISTRRIVHWNVSEHPDGQWVAQQFRNLSIVHEDMPRHLIHDRDSKFTAHADHLLRLIGTEPLLLPPRSPDLNGRAERWVRTARNESLDHIITLNEGHLRWAIGEFVKYYNVRRPHRSLGLRPPDGPADGGTGTDGGQTHSPRWTHQRLPPQGCLTAPPRRCRPHPASPPP